MADIKQMGTAGLQGWRKKVGDGVAGPAASKTPFSEDTIRAAIGALFFVLSVKYVIDTIREVAANR